MQIDGIKTISRAMLQSAQAAGTRYTADVDGILILEDDVTIEDIQSFISLKVDGVLLTPNATHAYLSSISTVDGSMLGSISEIKKMASDSPDAMRQQLGGMLPKQLLQALGLAADNETGDNGTMLNGSPFVLI